MERERERIERVERESGERVEREWRESGERVERGERTEEAK